MRLSLYIWGGFAFLVILLIVYGSDVQANPQTALYQSGALLLAEYTCLVFACRKLCGDYFNIATMFFIMAGVTNVIAAGIYASGLVENSITTQSLISRTPQEYFVYANATIGVAMFALFLGVQAAVRRPRTFSYSQPFIHGNAAKFAGLMILAVSFPAFIMTFTYDAKIFLAGGYASLFSKSVGDSEGALSTWYLQLSNLLPICGYFIFCGSKDTDTRTKRLGLGLLIMSALSSISLGSRSGFISPVIAFLWLRKKRGKKGSERIIFFTGIFFVALTPFFLLWRLGSAANTQHPTSLLDSVLTGLNNLGTVYYFIPIVIENFPSHLPFIHFDSLTSAIANCIPNIGGLYAGHTGVNRDIVYWLGQNYLVNVAAKTVSLETGYSFIAEAYQSFGFLGIFPIMLIVGYILGKITLISESTNSAYKIAFFASIIGYLLFYTRDTFYNLARPVVWYALPFLVLSLFLDRYRVRPQSRLLSQTIELE
jgi:oligosaccharide repeat unit polymerase